MKKLYYILIALVFVLGFSLVWQHATVSAQESI